MSAGKVFGYLLAGGCSVATGKCYNLTVMFTWAEISDINLIVYYTLKPELVKIQEEKQKAFQNQHDATKAAVQPTPKADLAPTPTAIQSGNMPTTGQQTSVKEEVQKSWLGLSLFKWSFGSAESSSEDSKKS